MAGRLVRWFLVVAIVGAAAQLLAVRRTAELSPPISVRVEGELRAIATDTTFGQAIAELHLHARSGRLLDVQGKILRYGADPGSILLNGEQAPRATPLADGDAIVVDDGTDGTEGLRRITTTVKGRKPGDPQFTLATAPVVKVTTMGRISGEITAVVYRPIGKAKRPPAVALTFDDGPWPGTTREVLRVLKRTHVKATFFVIGRLATERPWLVQLEKRAGMSIGNHSWDHPNGTAFAKLTPHRIFDEMWRTNHILRRRFGVRARLFRPPGGSYDWDVVQTARRLGLRVVNWDVDPHDWASAATKRSIVRNVLSNVRPGSIVDLHDGGGDQSATVAALPKIIRGIRKMGLRFVAL